MSKQYDSGQTLQQKIARGIDVLADNVAATMGPRGRNVILHQAGSNPIITKDGVTVAKFVDLEDPFENVGVQILKQVADQTNSDAGDGTTTSTVLARAIYKTAQQYVLAGSSPVELKRGMEKAVDVITSRLKDSAHPIKTKEDIEHIATISANGDKTIGSLIATAVDKAGKDGAITVEEARSMKTTLDIVEGFRFDSGFLSPQFINDERRSAITYHDPLILVTDARVDSVEDMLPALELVAREGRPFLIVAEEVEGQALAALIMNAVRGTMKVAAVKAPRYGEERRNILNDLALSVGATLITKEKDLSLRDVKLEHFGTAKKIDVTKHLTTLIDGVGEGKDIQERIAILREQVAQSQTDAEGEAIQERITRLASGVAIIRVGASTEVEMVEKRHRIEDALEAVRAAKDDGIVTGGGTALLRAVQNLEVETENAEQAQGVEIIKEACYEPIKQILINAGKSADVVINNILQSDQTDIGLDVATDQYVDMFEAGIVDPVKVTCCAVQNAMSVSSTLLTTNHAIIQ
jgi:chaperonin GroEL